MIIEREYLRTRDDGVKLYRTYSDANMMIRKDGADRLYSEAIDVEDSPFTYIETDIPIESETEDDQAQKAEAFDYLTGRSTSDTPPSQTTT